MGPLVPDVIGNELNLVVALVIGFLFGMILEQAGFSTAKKLVGLFYGYDFTVLRVFFTAGTVAMTGVIAFDHFGLLDISLIYINPTFLWSAIVGGLIMGLGFVIGGFCPGTSLAAAAIGKVDAMLFIGGSVLGVLIFAEGYPLFEGLYKAAFWGYPTIFTSLGIPRSLFAFLLVAIALTAFWAVSIIENKVNGIREPGIHLTPYYVSLASVGVLMALSAFVLPERRVAVLEDVAAEKPGAVADLKKMTPDELAYRIMEGDSKIQIIDFRPVEDFKKFSLPKSASLTIDNLFEKEPGKLLSIRHRMKVFVAQDEASEIKAALVAKELGFRNVAVLAGGLDAFKKEIIEFTPGSQSTQNLDQYTIRFRTKASQLIPVLIEQNKANAPTQKKAKRVLGGC